MSAKGHLFRGAIFSLAILSGEAIAQVYGLCGTGAGFFSGNIEVPEADIAGAIIIDGSVDCGGFCGGGGTSSGGVNGILSINAQAFASIGAVTMSECGTGIGFASLLGSAVGGAIAVGPSTAGGAESVAFGIGASAEGEETVAIGNNVASWG